MAELRPNIVFHGRHFVHHLEICNPICVKLLTGYVRCHSEQFKIKTASLSQTVFLRSKNAAYTHTHDDSIRRNVMHCISPKNEESKTVHNRFSLFLGQIEGNSNAHPKTCRHFKKVTRKVSGKWFENLNRL